MMRSLMLVLMLACVSCVAMGTKVEEGQLRQFERGKSRYADVIQSLGRPTLMTLNADGSRIVTYSYTQTQARAVNYIPIIGGFLQGGDTEQATTTLEFTPDGVLQTYSTTSGHTGIGTGFVSGGKQ